MSSSLAGTALSEQELQLLRGHDRIYLCFDQGPFDRAMLMGKRIARQTGVVPYLVELPQGVKDPNEFASQGHSRSEYGSLLEQSRELLDIMLEHTLSCTGLERADLERELLACMRRLSESDIERYRERAVPALGIKPEHLTAYLEAARGGKRVSLGGSCAEGVPDGPCLEIHPALDYVGEIGVVTVALGAAIDDKVVSRPYLITSNREKLELDGRQLQINGKRVLFQTEPKAPWEKRWREADIERFLEGDDPQPSKTFSSLLDIVKRHLDFNSRVQAEIVAVWCLGSYLFPLFGAYPYLHLCGLKGTGKAQAMALTSKMAFNMVLASLITPSAIFGSVQSCRCCVGFDNADDLRGAKDEDSQDLVRFLRAGYKEGARVFRWEADPGQGRRPRQHDVYSPKMIASRGPLEDILAGRCISMGMPRARHADISKVELADNGEDWAGMRHELYCFALNHFEELRKLYADEAGINIFLNRDHELWRPLFAVAKLLDERGAGGVLERLVDYAVKACGSASEGVPDAFDVVLIRTLESLLGRHAPEPTWVYASSIELRVVRDMEGRYSREQVAHRIAPRLRNLGFLSEPESKERTERSVRYYIHPEDMRYARERYGIKSVWS